MKVFGSVCAALGCLISAPANAYDTSFFGKVTYIEPTYVPDGIIFHLDAGGGSCAAGSNLTWTVRGSTEASRIANAQAILSVLMTAKMSGSSIDVYVNNSDCSVQFLHVI
jgi:hypothetical protein